MRSHITRKPYVSMLNENFPYDLELPNVDKRTKAICLTNMAQCHIKMEEFGTFSLQSNIGLTGRNCHRKRNSGACRRSIFP